jgi:formylglycine-generating enzyme required for sulfatase activity
MVWAALVLTAAVGLPAAEPAAKPRDKILKRFVKEFVLLTPGKGKFPAEFVLGSSAGDAPASEKPAVKVKLARPFRMARYEVTQELYQAVTGKNPSRWKGRRNSVERVSWDEAQDFCKRVTALLRKQKLLKAEEEIRLPSEAEWEYACRAGTKTRYAFGDKAADLGAYAWFHGNAKGEDPPVGRKKPNAWRLYDMHGYVWEWCADVWQDSHKGAAADGSPRVKEGEKERVIRGGSWADGAEKCTSAARDHKARTFRSDQIGFRCVLARAVKKKDKEDRR